MEKETKDLTLRSWFKITAFLIFVSVAVGSFFIGFCISFYCEPPKKQEIYNEPIWKELYAIELRKHIESFSPKFNIHDLDGDGVPELLISDDDCHAASGEIFTVYHGKLKHLGNFGSCGEFLFDPDNRYIISMDFHDAGNA